MEAIRRDIEGLFHHLRYSWESSLSCIGQIVTTDLLYGVMSSVAVMDDQTVNYSFTSLPLSTVATDDIIAVGPPSFTDSVDNQIGLIGGDGRRSELCSSESAIKPEKDLRGNCIVMLGWLFDVSHLTAWPNYLTFAKLVYCMFVVPEATPLPGDRTSVGDLMLMGPML